MLLRFQIRVLPVVLILAVAPLLVSTVLTFASAWALPATAVEVLPTAASVAIDDVQQKVQQLDASIETQIKVLKALPTRQLLQLEPVDFPETAKLRDGDANWVTLAKSLDGLQQRREAADYLRSKLPAGALTDLSADDLVAIAKPLGDWAGIGQMRELQQQIERAARLKRDHKSNDDAFKRIAGQLSIAVKSNLRIESSRFEDWLAELDNVPGDYPGVVELRRRLNFWLHWNPVNEEGGFVGDVSTVQLRRARLEELQSGDAPSPRLPDELKRVETVAAAIAQLQAKEQFLIFKERPPDDLAQFLDEARLLAERAERRPDLQRMTRTLVERSIVRKSEKKPTVEVFDFRLKNGQILLAGHDGSPASNGALWVFPYNVTDGTLNKRGQKQLYPQEYESPPKKPEERQLVDEFNMAREALLRDLSTRARWDDFQQKCRSFAERLQSYRAKQPVKFVPDLEFETESQAAQDVLERWTAMEMLYRR